MKNKALKKEINSFTDPHFITNTQSLKEVVERLQSSHFVTIDTEFLRENTYWPYLCLIQIAGEDEVVLIDPLSSELDLSLLEPLLQNPNVTKVFHAARQDLEIMFHIFGRLPSPLYDTQIAATVAGFGDQVGYDNLVSSFTGANISKTYRFTDWSIRPLSVPQKNYAAADVTYLRVVYESLRTELEKKGRNSWVQAEMAKLSDPALYVSDPEKMWMKIKHRSRDPKVLMTLKAVARWREEEAQKQNVPRQRIVKDETLVEIANFQPATLEQLLRVRGLNNDVARGRIGKEILETIEQALQTPKENWPEPSSRYETHKSSAVQGLLKVLLAVKCEENKVAPRLVASTEDLDRLIQEGEKAENLPLLEGWRRKIFGEEALALCKGELAIVVNGKKLNLVKQ